MSQHFHGYISVNGNTAEYSPQMHTEEEVCQWVEQFRTRSGVEIKHIRNRHHTDHPSVQGIWTPFTNKDTALNLAQFPNEELSRCPVPEISATERLLEKAKQLRARENLVELPESGSGSVVKDS